MFVATQSGFKNHEGKLIRSNETARKEGIRAMKVLEQKLIQGDFETLKIEFNEQLTRQSLI